MLRKLGFLLLLVGLGLIGYQLALLLIKGAWPIISLGTFLQMFKLLPATQLTGAAATALGLPLFAYVLALGALLVAFGRDRAHRNSALNLSDELAGKDLRGGRDTARANQNTEVSRRPAYKKYDR